MFVAVQVVAPGAYRTVCVELKLQHLAVNAIAQSALLADLEHTTLSDDGAGIAAVFGSLVKLVNAWLADATENASLYVVYCLENAIVNRAHDSCGPAHHL